MIKFDPTKILKAKTQGSPILSMKGSGWAMPKAGDGNILNLNVAPDSTGTANHWVVESFNPLLMGAAPGLTSALTGWPFLAKANTRYRITWDFTPIGFTWNGGDRFRLRNDNTGSNTGKIASSSTANSLANSQEFVNNVSFDRMLWIGPAAVISGAQRLRVNKFFLEIV